MLPFGGVLDHDLSSSGGGAAFAVSDGRLASRPRCESGSAAMKITSSTSSTSIIGVMFMSEDGRSSDGLIMASLGQRELHRDRHDHRHRHAVEQRRRVLPLAHRVKRRLIEQRDRSQDARIRRTRPSAPIVASMMTMP